MHDRPAHPRRGAGGAARTPLSELEIEGMQLRARLLTRVAAVGVSVAAVAVPLSMTTAAHAITGPTVTVTVNDQLVNGQTIKVSATGLGASQQAYIGECVTNNPADTAGCDTNPSDLGMATTDGTGAFTGASFKVHAGAIGNGFCPGKSAPGSCYVSVATLSPSTVVAYAKVTFAPVITLTPSTNVKSGSTIKVTGYGFPKKAETAYVLECSHASQTGCDAATLQNPTTTVNGTLTANVKVHSGLVGDKPCSAGGTCQIAATTDITGTLPDQSARATFTFAKSTTTTVATTLTATARAHSAKVTVAGAIKAAGTGKAGLSVVLYDRAKGARTWTKVASAKSGTGGAFSFSVKHLSHAEQYIVKHPKQTVSGKVYSASSSKISTVS
jgi:hypothetical protein